MQSAEDFGLEAIDAGAVPPGILGRPAFRQVCARNWSRVHPHSGGHLRQQQTRDACRARRRAHAGQSRSRRDPTDRSVRAARAPTLRRRDLRAPTAHGCEPGSSRAALAAHAPPPLPAAAGTRGCPRQPRSWPRCFNVTNAPLASGRSRLRRAPAADAPVTSACDRRARDLENGAPLVVIEHRRRSRTRRPDTRRPRCCRPRRRPNARSSARAPCLRPARLRGHHDRDDRAAAART